MALTELKEIKKIDVKPGAIVFKEFEELKRQAQEIAEFINSVDSSEENAAQAKKVLAASRKSVKALGEKRIEIKKAYLLPYENFEQQIKEITAIFDTAETALSKKLKAYEIAGRAEKMKMIESAYEFVVTPDMRRYAPLDWFMKPEYLNKTVSMARIEKELREKTNTVTTDLNAIETMEHAPEIAAEYIQSGGFLSGAIAAVQARHKVQETAKLVISKDSKMLDIPIEQENDVPFAYDTRMNADVAAEKTVISFYEDDSVTITKEPIEPEFIFAVKGEFTAEMVRGIFAKYEIEFTEERR